jgi:poly(A) polymerase
MQVAIDKLSDVLQCFPHFDRLLTLCSAKNSYQGSAKDAYLVGGAIRDALIGRQLTDLDLIFPDDPTSLARCFAREIGGHWFWLDKDRRQSRVVPNRDDEGLHYDFALFRAPDLESDLLDRDFTINALALPLAGDLSASTLVDPRCGLDDLRLGVLRTVDKESFRNDPLRIVKGVRHATVLALKIETETLQSMRSEVAGLDHVAPERIRQEIWKIISNEQAGRGLQLLLECGVWERLFGDEFTFQINKLQWQLEVYRERWSQLVQSHSIVKGWLAQEVEQGLSNETLLLWILLLTSIDRDLPIPLAEKWRLSRKARTNITAVLTLGQSALNELATIARNERAFMLWSSRYHIDPKLLLLAITVIGLPKTTFTIDDIRAWVPFVARLNDQRPNDLVDGHWLRNELGLKEGPEMTKALKLLRNAEISGQVSDKDEAHRFLVEYYRNRD